MKAHILNIIPLGLLLSVFALAAEPTAAIKSAPAVVGTWRLVSSESRTETGEVRPTLGADPLGVLMYDASGHMSVHLMGRNRSKFAAGDMRRGTPEELKAAFDSYVSYYGTYVIDATEGTISHHLEGCSFPNWTGTTQKRFLKLEGKRLSLSTPPIRVDGKDVRVFLIWERLN